MMPSICITTPCYRYGLTTLYTASVLSLQAACIERGIGFEWIFLSSALLPHSRSELLAIFLDKTSATHVLMVDSDEEFPADLVFRCLNFDKDFCAATCAGHIDWNRLRAGVRARHPDALQLGMTYGFNVNWNEELEFQDGFVKVEQVGTGFILAKREAMQRMTLAYQDLRYTASEPDELGDSRNRVDVFACTVDPETRVFCGEDFSFANRWRAIGGEIWLDTTAQIGHLRSMRLDGSVAPMFARET